MKDVTRPCVLGGHGDQMVPVVSATSVGGVPTPRLVAEASTLVARTANPTPSWAARDSPNGAGRSDR